MKHIVHLLCLLGALSASAATISWNSPSGGNWSVTNNWNPAQVPGAGDDVVITLSGTYTVNLDANPVVNSLTLGGASGAQTLNTSGFNLTLNNASVINTNGLLVLNGTLAGAGALNIGGELNWIAGQVNPGCVVKVATNGLLLSQSPALVTPNLFEGILTNAGTLRLAGGSFQLLSNTVPGGWLVNLPGALMDVTADVPIQTGSRSELVFNQGTLRKSGGTGTTVINPPLINPGTLDVQTGTVSLNGAGSGGGQFIAEAGANLVFLNNYEIDSALSGAGTNWINNGAIILKGAINGSNVIMQGGSLLASNAVINTALTWTFGEFNPGSVLTVATNALLLYAGVYSNFPSYFQGILTNAGTVRFADGSIELVGNGSTSGLLVNLPGALVDMAGDTSIDYNLTTEVVLNEGTIRKSGGTGTNYIYPVLQNRGKLDAQTGVISVNTNCVLTGGTLNFGINSLTNYGVINLAGSAALTGTASVNLNNSYAPAAGSVFGVLTYGAETGIFTNVLVPTGFHWTTNYGAAVFTVATASADFGALQVNLLPAGAVSAGAQWQVDGGAWQNSGATTNLAAGSHAVSYLPISGWTTPASQTVSVSTGVTTVTNGTYAAVPLTNQLQIRMVGLGTISPNYSNALLQIGQTYSMTAAPQSGFNFTNWTVATNWIGGQVTNNATVQFMMASNLTLTVAFVNQAKPTLSITNVPVGLSVSNVSFTVRGVAGDTNWHVANVLYSLNGAGWSNAATANNWSNWTAAVSLAAGTNTFAAYAVDPGGQASVTTNASLFFLVTNQLQLRTLGRGTITPNDSNAWLQIGRYYSITSAPASGFVFSNWTLSTNWLGTLVKTGASLQFMMQSNLTLQATFAETSAPTLAITAPANLQRMTNALAAVTGTASDIYGMSEVRYQLNHGAWSTALTTNSWTNWSTTLELISGTNSISAQAINLGGVYSTTSSVSVYSSNSFLLQLVFTNAAPLKTNGLVFSLELSKGLAGHLQFSTNLTSWAVFTNFVGTNSPLIFRDPAATNSSRRFYRAVIP